MSKFLTVMTVFVLFGFKSYGLDPVTLQELAQAIPQFKLAVEEMEIVYDKGIFKADLKKIKSINENTAKVFASVSEVCKKMETEFTQRNPEALAQKQSMRERAILKAKSLLDAVDSDLLSAQTEFVLNLGNAKYCLSLTSQKANTIRASVSQ